MDHNLILVPAVALLVGLGAPALLRPLLRSLGTYDTPNHRSSHSTTVLRGGGIAPAGGVVAAVAAAWAILFGHTPHGVAIVALTVLSAAVLGALEDIRGVSVRVRAACQLAIGLGCSLSVVLVHGAPWWLAPLGAIAVAGYINVANFMDGVNGISSLHGLATGGVFALVGAVTQTSWLVVAGLALAAAYLAFLPWNLFGRRMFLGDVGSYALGAAVASLSLVAVATGVPPLAALAPLAVYLADTASTFFRRLARGASWHEAHREHAYQAHVVAGRSHLFSAALTFVLTVGCGLLGLASLGATPFGVAACLAGVLALGVVHVVLPRALSAFSADADTSSASSPATAAARVPTATGAP
ncbi:UDP-phosphate glycosyltransferase [Frondihabitans australicus]|uniref:UDP-N-acetylmuramyl pentapeptide phosphotransferase/UDP-N-acetylglucosamine-1-phosphate transferase n=1 Tax=Frondihabitans australicus TaxID=386892 RepID=A0A495IJC9_9MICO|nr:UDP-phosphate glycosyltransferase [Frondihabitans australicus]RKR76132.1 UDP-N-acetylmuramyl pentapeptide phosphotransferase/UDP-N-acetylglucosamine-1-phosphate transferase [Frondihabitans australicus]